MQNYQKGGLKMKKTMTDKEYRVLVNRLERISMFPLNVEIKKAIKRDIADFGHALRIFQDNWHNAARMTRLGLEMADMKYSGPNPWL
jgi:hypothetical protein